MFRVVGSKRTVKGAVFYFLLQSWNRTFISGPAETWVDTMAAVKKTAGLKSESVCGSESLGWSKQREMRETGAF